MTKEQDQRELPRKERKQRELLNTSIDLLEGEEITYFVNRHWAELIPKMASPILIALVGLAFFAYRALGGTFVSQWPFVYVDPRLGAVQTFDALNLVLLGLSLVGIVFAYYLYVEWNDDYLILTNRRVIAWKQDLLGRHTQNQMDIDDVKSVLASTKTYLQHWLGYGTITVTSAAFGSKLEFKRAGNPQEMQKRINGGVGNSRQRQNKQYFDSMIQSNVYNTKPQERTPWPLHHLTRKREGISRLFEDNPQIDEESGTVLWRKHWVFLPVVLTAPVIFLVVSLVILFTVSQFVSLGTLWMTVLIVPVLLVFLGWGWYEVEDESNERYQLTANDVKSLYKKPLGPEESNVAGLGGIQNVTHKTTFFSRLLKYGDVVIDTAGGGKQIIFQRIPRPSEASSTISEYQALFRKREKYTDALTLLKYYHQSQQEHQRAYLDELLMTRLPSATNGNRESANGHQEQAKEQDTRGESSPPAPETQALPTVPSGGGVTATDGPLVSLDKPETGGAARALEPGGDETMVAEAEPEPDGVSPEHDRDRPDSPSPSANERQGGDPTASRQPARTSQPPRGNRVP
ncbi:MAG: PH domain-containing protein [Chloroflexaceae bacterium]|nr:PH domain-containing protein [Chloroflexaceae bacterium]